MSQCPNCGRVYDESDYARCPWCYPEKWKKPNTATDLFKRVKAKKKHN